MEVPDMNSARRLVVGAAVAVATAAALWGPTAVLAGITATAIDWAGTPSWSAVGAVPNGGSPLPITEELAMKSTRRLVAGAIVAAATAAAVWGPTAVLAGIVARGVDW
jgi:hypothetical protein